METRKVTIINSKTQSQKVIQDSKATTLGELKQEMRERGINYEGMTFYEGHIRAELIDDAASLPNNIPYKGQVVNDLVFMLTTPNKNIKSGAMSREEVYSEIKKRNLQDICWNEIGRNFTQCSTKSLIELINKYDKKSSIVKKSDSDTNRKESKGNILEVLNILVNDLYNTATIDTDVYNRIMTCLSGNTPKDSEEMSQSEIDEMFNFI